MSERIAGYLAGVQPPTPCLVLDLDIVADRYRALRAAFPAATVYYAVKANPEPALLRRLCDLGSSFDVASPGEIDLVLDAGASPARISYGNTIKKQADIAYAYARGVRLFAFDSQSELDKLAAAAPGASVFCRILTGGNGADWPLSRKFGCEPRMALDLLRAAAERGLDPCGVSFHVGSQQRDPFQWDTPLAEVAALFAGLAASGIAPRLVNLGGGFPAQYRAPVPRIDEYADAIADSLARHFPNRTPDLIVEPGRYLAGDAGVLCSEVVLVSRKSEADERRWVYLDAGVFGGLAETLGESIKYRICTTADEDDAGEPGPVVIAGPTCDSMDVLYETCEYRLPQALQPGDRVMFLSAGAYTRSYCSIGFNGFEPLPVHCL